MQKPTALDDILRFAPPPSKNQGLQNDAGAGDENSSRMFEAEQKPQELEYSETPSSGGLVLNEDSHGQTDIDSPSIFCRIGYYILRTVFYLAILSVIVIAGVYVGKLAGVYDPCKEYYTSETKCTVTSYMKGVLHHINCIEERYCLLPGFSSNTSQQSWSLKEPPMQAPIESEAESASMKSQRIPESSNKISNEASEHNLPN